MIDEQVLHEAGDIQHIIDLGIRTKQFKVWRLIRLGTVLADDLHISWRREQLKDILDRAQTRTGKHFQTR